MPRLEAMGWGCTYNNRLEIRTVTDSELGAKINALGFLGGQQIRPGTPAFFVDNLFTQLEFQGVKLVRVRCEAIEATDVN